MPTALPAYRDSFVAAGALPGANELFPGTTGISGTLTAQVSADTQVGDTVVLVIAFQSNLNYVDWAASFTSKGWKMLSPGNYPSGTGTETPILNVLTKTMTADDLGSGAGQQNRRWPLVVGFNLGSTTSYQAFAEALSYSGSVAGFTYAAATGSTNNATNYAPDASPGGPATVLRCWAVDDQGNGNNDYFASWPASVLGAQTLRDNYAMRGTIEYVGGASGDSLSVAVTEQANNTSSSTGTAPGQTPGAEWVVNTYQATVVLLPATAPSAPTLTAPVGAAVDATEAITLTAKYNPTDGAPCNAYSARVKSSGAYQFYDATSGTLTSTPTWNNLTSPVVPGGTIMVILPAGLLSNGASYAWSIATQESAENLQGSFAADALFTARPRPTLGSVTPNSTVTDTSEPQTAWTASAASGTTLQSYRVVWETGSYGTIPGSGTQVADTGVVLGTSPATPPALTNLDTYRVFVQVTQSDGQVSDWDYGTFPLNLVLPAVPTVTLSASSPDAPPSAVITVQGHDGGPTYDHTNTVFDVQGSADDGVTWLDVRTADMLSPDGSDRATATDYEAAIGTMTYRARTIGSNDGNIVYGNWCTPVTVEIDSDSWWLMDPLDPSTALQIDIITDGDTSRPISQDITATLGSSEPVIESDVRQLRQGQTTWLTEDVSTKALLLELLSSGVVLFQRTPSEAGPDCALEPGDTRYFLPTGAITETRFPKRIAARQVTTAWAERSRP